MATILIVDDEQAFCNVLTSLMQRHGHEVFTAYNGKDALALFTQQRPHFTLLDLHMPEMDGIETLKQIRAIDRTAAVMILTAWGTDEIEQQARRLGVTDFLSKALSLDAMMASMERGLTLSAQAPTTAGQSDIPGPLSETRPEPPGTPETDAVFLVEWDHETRNTFVHVLRQYGIAVNAAQDGPTLLTMLRRQRPQLVALDIDMPGMNGPALLRSIRQQQYRGGIIIMTSRDEKWILQEAVALGSIDLLGKPVSPERLMLAIQVGLVLLRS